jgi:hypothetical protein
MHFSQFLAIKMDGGVEVWLQAFLTPTLDVSGWLHVMAAFHSQKGLLVYTVNVLDGPPRQF